MVKVIAAFVGGIVVAVGSTLIYVKAHQGNAQQALVQTAPPPSDPASLPDADRGTPPQAADEQPAAPTPKPARESVKPKPRATSPLNASVGHKYRHNDQPGQPPVLLAQNTPPQQPAANPPANPYTST